MITQDLSLICAAGMKSRINLDYCDSSKANYLRPSPPVEGRELVRKMGIRRGVRRIATLSLAGGRGYWRTVFYRLSGTP